MIIHNEWDSVQPPSMSLAVQRFTWNGTNRQSPEIAPPAFVPSGRRRAASASPLLGYLNLNGITIQAITGPFDITPGSYVDFMTASTTGSSRALLVEDTTCA
jgi:hypothetical protein